MQEHVNVVPGLKLFCFTPPAEWKTMSLWLIVGEKDGVFHVPRGENTGRLMLAYISDLQGSVTFWFSNTPASIFIQHVKTTLPPL